MTAKLKGITQFELDPSKPPKLSKRQKARLDSMTDADIDYSDIPELTDEYLAKFYKPVKQVVTLRLDADVLSWLKKKHPKYQTAVNNILRQHMKDGKR